MSTRIPLSRWVRPTHKALEGIYPSGRPPFYPFPTVTNLINVSHCPVAIYHELLHGIDWAVTSSPGWGLRGVGNLFHEFIAFLKSSIAKGKLKLTGIDILRHEFVSFARNVDDRTRDLCWSHYLEPWIRRKFQEIQGLKQGTYVFFEMLISNAYVPFFHNGERRSYPLVGKIDEIDVGHRRIIERTIKGKLDDTSPPHLKDYQVWLLWKSICSIDPSNYPKQWKDIDFGRFDLVVETPYKDFQVKKNNSEFEKRTHEAYAWIHDLAFDKRSEYEVYQHRRCTFAERDNECGLLNLCYRRRQPYPTSRPEMRRTFRDMYRPLYWEQMWNWHLLQYQLVMLPTSVLERVGLVSKGKMMSFSEGKIEVEVPGDQADSMWARREVAGRYMILPFGTFFVGNRMVAVSDKRVGNRLVMRVMKREIPISETVLILSLESDFPILESSPWYLTRLIQREMFTLEYVGTKDPNRASKDSVVQLIESLFGRKALRREGVDQSQ